MCYFSRMALHLKWPRLKVFWFVFWVFSNSASVGKSWRDFDPFKVLLFLIQPSMLISTNLDKMTGYAVFQS